MHRDRPAKRYMLPPMAVRQGVSMVQPPRECVWCGAGDGFVAVSVTSGDPYGGWLDADQSWMGSTQWRRASGAWEGRAPPKFEFHHFL